MRALASQRRPRYRPTSPCPTCRQQGTGTHGRGNKCSQTLVGMEQEQDLFRQTVRKKRNLSPGSICCLFTSMTRCPFSSLSWQSTSKCMSCICICCCFLISSQCRDVMKMHILKFQMSLHQTKPTGVCQGEGCLQMPPYSFSRGFSWCLWCGKPRVADSRMGP